MVRTKGKRDCRLCASGCALFAMIVENVLVFVGKIGLFLPISECWIRMTMLPPLVPLRVVEANRDGMNHIECSTSPINDPIKP